MELQFVWQKAAFFHQFSLTYIFGQMNFVAQVFPAAGKEQSNGLIERRNRTHRDYLTFSALLRDD